MNQSTKLIALLTFAASGVLLFACGGAASDANGSNAPTASASSATPSAQQSVSAAPSSTATASASAAEATPPAPPLVLAAMKLQMPKSPAIEVKADGTIWVNAKQVAKFVGAELDDADGKTIISVTADGSLASPLTTKTKEAKFDDKNALEIGGGKVFVNDAGVVIMTNPQGQPDKASGKAKFVGFKPAARRAATLLVIGMTMPSGKPTVTAAATSGPAATPPKTK